MLRRIVSFCVGLIAMYTSTQGLLVVYVLTQSIPAVLVSLGVSLPLFRFGANLCSQSVRSQKE